MNKVKSQKDIDDALEATGASIIEFDTVAIWDMEEELWGVYYKHPANPAWKLMMELSDVKVIGG